YVIAYAAVNFHSGARGIAVLKNIISGILFGAGREIPLYSVTAFLALGVLAESVSPRPLWRRVLESPTLQHIGKISYGGYVYHFIVVVAVSWLVEHYARASGEVADVARKVLIFAVAYPIALGVAHLSYVYFERPIIRAARALEQRWSLVRIGN